MAGQESSQVFHMHYGDSLDDKNFTLHGRGTVLLLALICILLFFTLLYLYFRWACSSNPTGTAAITATVATNITNRTERNNGFLGLDIETINSISVRLYEGGEKKECAICLGGLVKGEKVKILPICSHVFHSVCIDTWLKTQPSCPLCRSSVVEEI